MDKPMNDKTPESELAKLRHDVKNQLSNIQLSIEQLRYEIPDISEDCLFYLDTIDKSCIQINSLLDDKPAG